MKIESAVTNKIEKGWSGEERRERGDVTGETADGGRRGGRRHLLPAAELVT